MHNQLQKLVGELRRETCPADVMDRVAQHIARAKTGPHRFRLPWGWGVAFLALLVALGAWEWQAGRDAERGAVELEAKARVDRERVAAETAGALGYIGHILLGVAAQSQNSILKEAIPQLRESLQTTKNKVINRI